MSVPDYYAMTAEVADALRLAGRCDFGDALDAAVAAGFTSTEVLMGVRHILRNQMSDAEWPTSVTDDAARLVGAIDEALANLPRVTE